MSIEGQILDILSDRQPHSWKDVSDRLSRSAFDLPIIGGHHILYALQHLPRVIQDKASGLYSLRDQIADEVLSEDA